MTGALRLVELDKREGTTKPPSPRPKIAIGAGGCADPHSFLGEVGESTCRPKQHCGGMFVFTLANSRQKIVKKFLTQRRSISSNRLARSSFVDRINLQPSDDSNKLRCSIYDFSEPSI